MKGFRYLLLFCAMLMLLLSFTACDFSFMGGLMTPTTAPTTTTSPATTTEPTTTAPVTTTVPVTTTAPVEISQNPIKSISLLGNGDRIQFKYDNNVKQNLVVDAGVREGFNSAVLIDYDFDTETRIVSLTYQAALNRAEVMLGNETASPITLYLREMNGQLEYTEDLTSPNWVAFAPAKNAAAVNGVPILTALLNAVEYGKCSSDALGEGMVLTVKQEISGQEQDNLYMPGKNQGAYLRFRATEWMNEGYDLITDARRFGSKNWAFNMLDIMELSSSTSYDVVEGGVRFKHAGDDITPLHFNGTYIGGNHGYGIIAALPNTTGLTEEDIGSVWKCGTQKYVLVKVYANSDTGGEEMAWFCPFDDTSMQTGIFSQKPIASGSVLTHVSGATHTENIRATQASKYCQFLRAINHHEQHVFLNGTTEIDLDENGVYEAEFIDFHEVYDIIYLPAMLEFLMENISNNDNFTNCDESIEDAYVTFDITYRFHKNGACVVYTDYTFRKAVEFHQISGIQSYPWVFSITDDYLYIPGTIKYNEPTKHAKADETVYTWDQTDLENPDVPTSSYFQLSDAVGTKAMNLGYYPLYGDAIPENRMELTGRTSPFGESATSLKLYPNLARQSKGALAAGTSISFISYRIPTIPTHEDMLAVNHYWVGEDIILSLHTQEVLDGKEIALPDYMNGMTVTLIEKSESMTLGTTVIENGKIAFSTNNAGYAIVKLSPAK